MRASRFGCLAATAALTIIGWNSAALAQPCEWDGERTICPVNPQGSSSGSSAPFGIKPGWLIDLFRSHPKPRDLAFERTLTDYQSNLQLIFENSRSLNRWNFKKPKSRDDLSRRIDELLVTVWPEYTSSLQEYHLLRQQTAFYQRDNPSRRSDLANDRSSLLNLQSELPKLRAQAAQLQRSLTEARAREAELSPLALRLINDRTSENRAIATLLVFTLNPGFALSDLDPKPPVRAVPGTTAEFYPPGIALAADSAEPRVPTQYQTIDIPRPPTGAPIDQKLNFMQVVGRDFQTMWFNTPTLRNGVAAAKAENDSLKSEDAKVLAEMAPLAGERYALQTQMVHDEVNLDGTKANLQAEARTIFKEVMADMALDAASEKIKSLVDSKLHLEGAASTTVPTNSAEALLEAAKHGTKLLMPASYQQQWQTVLDVQGKAWNVLGRNQGFMLDAAHLLASGSVPEGEAYAEKVFATANWQSFDMVKTVGMGELPEGEEKSVVEGIFERVLGKIKKRQTGEE